jgi:predicted dehydrogenase
MFSLSRRDFLKGSAALAAAAATGPALEQVTGAAQQNQNGGPNDRLRVAVLGVNGRGRDHIAGLAGRHNCIVTHICDCDEGVIGAAMTSAERAQGMRPAFVQDLRQIMDNNNIDIVTVATPNHWHSLAAIWAMQAGKHVYVEKPVSHNVWEGKRLAEIARQTNKICQAGTQIRSQRGAREAIEFLHAGRLGRIRVARGLCYKTRNSIGRVGPNGGNIPNSINYDIWCGPAPVQRPMPRTRLHYDWHWTWDYGNGDLGNQGIHQMDVARWGLNKSQLSNSITSIGGRFGYTDDGETANTQVAVFDYDDAQLIFEVRGLSTNDYRGSRIGNVFHCENGVLVFTSYSAAVAYNNDGEVIQRFNAGGDHYGNFIQAVRSGRRQDLNGEVQEGHLSSALCHLANISHRLGSPARFNARIEAFTDNEAATETYHRMRDHLRDNRVAVDTATYTLGPRLQMNPETERFTNNEQANAMLTREYRRGYEVPART